MELTEVNPVDPNLDPRIVELIGKYRLDPCYGEGWTYGETAAKKVVDGVESRDYGKLHALKYMDTMKFSREVFRLLTGIKLPKAQRDSDVILREFCTSESIKQHEFDQIRRWGEVAAGRLRQSQVNHNGVVINGQQFLDELIADGFCHLEEETHKGRKRLKLGKLEHGCLSTYYLLKSSDAKAYAAYAVKEVGKVKGDGNQE